MYTFIYNTCSYSFPIRMDAYFVCVLSIILMRKNPQKGACPLHVPISMIVYMPFLVNMHQLLGYAVLVILLVIPRYKKYYFIFIQ